PGRLHRAGRLGAGRAAGDGRRARRACAGGRRRRGARRHLHPHRSLEGPPTPTRPRTTPGRHRLTGTPHPCRAGLAITLRCTGDAYRRWLRRRASATAPVRVATPSLVKRLARWDLTVAWLMKRRLAMEALSRPSATAA